MSDPSIPLLPFDPRDIGPLELVKRKCGGLRKWADDNSTVVVIGFVLLTVAAWHFNIGLPKLPNWFLVGIGGVVFFSPFAIVTGWALGKGLYRDDKELLSEVDPNDGDQRLRHIAPQVFEEMRVINHNGVEVDHEYLKRVSVNGRRGYEVDAYDPEHNVAVASSMAGRSNLQIRRDRSEIRQIKTDLEEQADKALELIANHTAIIREQVTEVSMHIVRVAEGVELPDGKSLHDGMRASLEENDPTEDLLGDLADDEEKLDLDEYLGRTDTGSDGDASNGESDVQININGGGGSIFEKAAQNGHTEENDE